MDDTSKYKAFQTQQQIRALRLKLNKSTILSEIESIKPTLAKIQRSSDYKEDDCFKWLKNSWNTERILRLSQEIVEQKDNYFALQWSFPQAYYSVFCSIQAYFYAMGEIHKSHAATLKFFSKNLLRGIYPKNMCFFAEGNNCTLSFSGLDIDDNKRTLELNENESCSIDTCIGHFLKSTREMLLAEKKDQLLKDSNKHQILLTKKKKASRKLNSMQWSYVNEKVESTTLLHLLYRKRIKANYKDIDTFQYPGLESSVILKDLIKIVAYMNFVHEYLISRYIGYDKLKRYALNFDKEKMIDWFQKRMVCIEKN